MEPIEDASTMTMAWQPVEKRERVRSQLAVRVCPRWAPLPMEVVYKVCDTTGLWDTLDCAFVDPTSCGEGRSYNKKSGSENDCPLQPRPVLFMLYFYFSVFGVFFAFLLFLVNSAVTPSLISVHFSTGKYSANAFPIHFQQHGVGILGAWKPISTLHPNGHTYIWKKDTFVRQ